MPDTHPDHSPGKILRNNAKVSLLRGAHINAASTSPALAWRLSGRNPLDTWPPPNACTESILSYRPDVWLKPQGVVLQRSNKL